MALALSKSNARVIITSRNKNKLKSTLKLLGEGSSGYNYDLTKDKELEQLYKKIKKKMEVLI